MKINKPIAFVSLETVFIEIERSKVSVPAFIILKKWSSLPVLLLSHLNEYSIKLYKRNWFVTLLKMKINKQFAFASFDKVFIKIERSKVRVSAWILEFFKNMD